jgi:hypothetical protein
MRLEATKQSVAVLHGDVGKGKKPEQNIVKPGDAVWFPRSMCK